MIDNFNPFLLLALICPILISMSFIDYLLIGTDTEQPDLFFVFQILSFN